MRPSSPPRTLLTAIATLGLGEHYLIDLLLALSFCLAVFAACTPSCPHRRLLILSGVILTLSWLMLLRLAGPWLLAHPASYQTALAVTCLVSVAGLIRLYASPPAKGPA